MQNYNLKIFLVTFLTWLFLIVPISAVTQVTQLVFETPPREVVPGVLSEVLTVQTQNAAGERVPVGQTADVAFVSSSIAGEFLNEAGNPVSTTMASNASRRNFYYRDSTLGIHTLTVTVTVRDGGPSWIATQMIAVGTSLLGGESGDGGEEEAEAVPAAVVKPKTASAAFRVEIRRPALLPAGAPAAFEAKLSGVQKDDWLRLQWSFGDGGQALGREVFHTYRFPGDYVVVLNAARNESERLTVRTTMKVIKPELMISEIVSGGPDGGYIRLENRAANEINLGGFVLEAAGRRFVFPPDTILGVGGKINFAAENTGLNPSAPTGPVFVFSPDGRLAAAYQWPAASSPVVPPASQELAAAETLARINWEVKKVAGQVARLQAGEILPQPEVFPPSPGGIIISDDPPEVSDPDPDPDPADFDAVGEVSAVELPRSRGVLARSWSAIKNLFGGD